MAVASQRKNIYIACENMDFIWDEQDVWNVDRLWDDGWSVWDIAKAFNRDPDEVAILIIDRVRNGFIQKRPGGAYGKRDWR